MTMTNEGGNGARMAVAGPATGLTNRELIARIVAEGTALLKKEIELARAELTDDLRTEVRTAKALGVAAVLGLCGLTLVFVTVAAALATVMPAWLAALVVTLVVLAAAAIVAVLGWRKRVRSPLARTRRHLRQDVRYVRNRLS